MPTLPASRRPKRSALPAAIAAVLLAAVVAAPASASRQDRYGYYRVIEGNASVVQGGSSQPAQENQPLLTGDRLWTSRGSRAEVVLADNTVVRVAGDTEVGFEGLAESGDTYADGDYLTLHRGELQLVSSGAGQVRIDTDNATVYLRDAGSFRVETRDDTTLVVVRNGSAEVRTRRGAVDLSADEEAWIEGDGRPEVENAGTWDSLERWASTLDDSYRRSRWNDDYVDSSLGYASSRMSGYGSWVTYQSRRCWRPRVAADWSPYRHGRWHYTPSGLTWVSYEPWGWVPYHYGTWDYVPGYGWAWFPGRTYAPAWVYWYWGPSHVGWCPIGYYSHYYGPRYYGGWGFDLTFGFGFGIHGWAGGSPRWFDRWNFVDCHSLYDRRLSSYTRTAVQIGERGLPRGVIATETRGLGPALATRPNEGMRLLSNGVGYEKPIRNLPDVTRFVARDPNLPAEVGRVALPVDRKPAVGGRGNAGDQPWTRPSAAAGGKPVAPGRQGDWRNGAGDEPAGVRGGSAGGWTPGGGEAHGTRPRGGTVDSGTGDQGWRSGGASPRGGSGRAAGDKPVVRPRPDGASGDTPSYGEGGRPSGDWRRPGAPSPGATGSTAPREGSSGREARPRGGRDDGWRGSGGSRPPGRDGSPQGDTKPGSPPQGRGGDSDSPDGAVDRSPRSGGSDDWRSGGGGDTGSSGSSWHSPVRRIVEGVRNNRPEPGRPEAVDPGADRPSFDAGSRRPERPAPEADPAPWRGQSSPGGWQHRPAPDPEPRPDVARPSEPRHSRDSKPSEGESRGAGRGDRSNSDGGREDSGDRGGASHTRPSHDDSDGDPNR
jgi:hypothetical protein